MLELKGVSLKYGSAILFRGLDLELATGDRVLLAGRSGIGKTGIMRLILGLERPTTGTIRFLGTEVTADSSWEARQRMAYVPQTPDLGEGTVAEVVDRIFRFRANRELRPGREALLAELAAFGLGPDTRDQDFGRLSGGEKQRIAIVIALLLHRELYLLDEATASLDTTMKSRVIRRFADNAGITVLAISHDREWQSSGGFRVVNLEDYRVGGG